MHVCANSAGSLLMSKKTDKPRLMLAEGRQNGRHQAVSVRASCAKIAALFAASGFFCTAPISFTDDFFKVTDLSVGEAPLQHGY